MSDHFNKIHLSTVQRISYLLKNGPYSLCNYGLILYPSPETCMYAVHDAWCKPQVNPAIALKCQWEDTVTVAVTVVLIITT